MPKLLKKCLICDNEFLTYSKKQFLCSRLCSSIHLSGSNNGSYGKKWSYEKKLKQSEIIKSKVDDNYREKCGSANKGVKFDQSRIDAMHKHRESDSYSHKHSDESKRKISKKSSEKWTEEYKRNYHKKMVELGRFISPEDKTDFKIYQSFADWKYAMWNYADYDIFKQKGVYNVRKNRDGLVRDHKLSKRGGFLIGLFPEILRHPANCDFLSHSENSSKREKCSITTEELIYSIKNYEDIENIIEEHHFIIDLINRWEYGEKFSAEEYRRKSYA